MPAHRHRRHQWPQVMIPKPAIRALVHGSSQDPLNQAQGIPGGFVDAITLVNSMHPIRSAANAAGVARKNEPANRIPPRANAAGADFAFPTRVHVGAEEFFKESPMDSIEVSSALRAFRHTVSGGKASAS
jgi:hypothetical protein